MKVIVLYRILYILAQQVVIHERLCGLAGELHHHARRGICIHVGILASNIIVLDIDNLQEDVSCLRLTRNRARATIFNIYLSNVWATGFHQLVLNHILDFLHGHLRLTANTNSVGNLHDQLVVLTSIGGQHCLTDCSSNLLFIEANYAAITLYYCLYHTLFSFVFFILLRCLQHRFKMLS